MLFQGQNKNQKTVQKKIRAPWIFVKIRDLNINLFDVLWGLEISFSTCRTRYCATRGHRGLWSVDKLGSIWRSWDPFPLSTPCFGDSEFAVNNANMLHKNLTWDLSSSEMCPVGFHMSAKEIVQFFKISSVPLSTVLERQEDRKEKNHAWLNTGTSEMTGKNI